MYAWLKKLESKKEVCAQCEIFIFSSIFYFLYIFPFVYSSGIPKLLIYNCPGKN